MTGNLWTSGTFFLPISCHSKWSGNRSREWVKIRLIFVLIFEFFWEKLHLSVRSGCHVSIWFFLLFLIMQRKLRGPKNNLFSATREGVFLVFSFLVGCFLNGYCHLFVGLSTFSLILSIRSWNDYNFLDISHFLEHSQCRTGVVLCGKTNIISSFGLLKPRILPFGC